MANTAVQSVDTKGKGCKVVVKSNKTEKEETIECDIVLSAVGVAPNTENIGLETLGIKTDRGLVLVVEYYKKNVAGIYLPSANCGRPVRQTPRVPFFALFLSLPVTHDRSWPGRGCRVAHQQVHNLPTMRLT